MNLSQRRLLDSFQKTTYPEWKKSFDAIVGFEMAVEPKWDTFFNGTDGMSDETISECWNEFYFRSLSGAFALICADQMGKDAVREQVKKIVIDGTADTSNPEATTFEGGTFTVNHKPSSYSCSVQERSNVWRKLLESKL
jgi:hypothetical protein